MKRALMITAAALFVLPAFAADLPRPAPLPQPRAYVAPVDPFSGIYISGLVGYANENANFAPFTKFSNGGVTAGAELGVRKRIDPGLVIGVAVDGLWTDASGTNQISKNVSATHKLQGLESGRVVLGLPYNNWLFYATGGLAGGQGSASVTFGKNTLTDNANHLGWVAGGGVEYAFAQQWSVKGEYRHYDLGKATYASSIGGGAKIGVDGKVTADVGLLGVSFRY